MAHIDLRKQFGNLPPKYNFSLNPYPEERFSKCPVCQNKTGQRKLPLLIHVHPKNLIALNYTNRYCQHCDILIGQKHEIEHLLTEKFLEINPEIIGNDYLVFGTVEKQAWRENINQPKPVNEMPNHISEFKSYKNLRMTMAGWFRDGQDPPVMEPPPSKEWLKGKTQGRKNRPWQDVDSMAPCSRLLFPVSSWVPLRGCLPQISSSQEVFRFP